MIPKIIHYCWFGGNPKPKLAQRCIKSWKQYCPDYEIVEWNEGNFSLEDAPMYVRQAYQAKKWAFVTDYVRAQVVYEHGGIYLDTDVELIKPLDVFLTSRAYFGFEDGRYVNTGLGFGAEKGHPILKEIMADYEAIPYLLPDGKCDDTPCPKRNTGVFLKNGLRQDNSLQRLGGDVLILPMDYLCSKDWKTGELHVTQNTHSIHHSSASWYTPEMRKRQKKRHQEEWCRHLPSRVGNKLLGEKTYAKLREKLKR